jgi:hypothetical protein
MQKKNVGQPLSKQVKADQEFTLADDYSEEYLEAKVTLVEEEKVEYNLGEGEAKESVALAKAYSRKKQHKLVNQASVEEILPTSHQPGLLVRRLKKNA